MIFGFCAMTCLIVDRPQVERRVDLVSDVGLRHLRLAGDREVDDALDLRHLRTRPAFTAHQSSRRSMIFCSCEAKTSFQGPVVTG